MKNTILFLFLLMIFLSIYVYPCDIIDSDFNTSEFFVDLEGFEATPVKKETFVFLGNISIEKRNYKNSKNKLKVRLYKGKNLIDNWKSLLFTLSGFSENSFKEVDIENFKANLYEKGSYKAIILPVVETSNSGLIIIFSSEDLALEGMIDLIKKFPLHKLYLSPCSQN